MKEYNKRMIIDNADTNEELDLRVMSYLKSVDVWNLAAFALNLILIAAIAVFLFVNARQEHRCNNVSSFPTGISEEESIQKAVPQVTGVLSL